MKKYILVFITVVLLINFSPHRAIGQTTTVQYDVDWHTANQNMWGPNGTPFTINMDIDLIDISFGDTTSFNAIQTIFGGQFGVAMTIGTWLDLGVTFSLHGFTTGSVDVTYPTTIDLTFPNNYTFNPGSWVTINSDYTVDNGWALDTYFPTAGIAQLDLFFGFGIFIDATICIFNCVTVTPININIPTDSINIFYLNSQNGVCNYPCLNNTPPYIPPFMICHDTLLPIYFSIPSIGLTGWIDIPYIITTDWLDQTNQCLYASGEDHWLQLDIDVIQLLSAICGLIPPPTGPAIQQFLGMLSGTIDLGGGLTIDYVLLAMTFGIGMHMQQDFTFCPKLWTTFTMPTSVPFNETDPGGAIVHQGDSNIITIQIHNDLHFKYPCSGYPTWDMGIQHFMTNEFTNHTWDSLCFDFTITAFEFWINIPFPIMPDDYCIPPMCMTVQVDCPPDYAPTDTCWQEVCTPEICTPPTTNPQPDWQIHIGPLFQMTFPIGYIPITWYEDTWQLAGWTPNQTGIFDTIVPNYQIIPNPPMELSLTLTQQIICFGDSTGELTAAVTGGTPPYTYEWSTGDSITTTATSNSLNNLGAGTYSVTVTDVNGCFLSDTMVIANVDPPLYMVLDPTMVTCVGGSDGSIVAHVTGGTPGYTYIWLPIGGNDSIADSLPAGTYTCIATDLLGCQVSDMFTLIELYPLPPVAITGEDTTGCQPLRVQFHETSPIQGQTYLWNFHDHGVTDIDKNPYHIFEDSGYYNITCIVTSIHGCVDSVTHDSMVVVYPKPVAMFTPTPSVTDIIEPNIFFDNQSTTRFAQYWLFGDGETSTEFCPIHPYDDSGKYTVTLYVATEHGCKDTVQGNVTINETITFFAPTAFTPDHNGNNEVFRIFGSGIDPKTFNLKIFDRWGKMVYEYNDPEGTWDGKVNGKPSEAGVYSFVCTYKDIVKRKHRYRGSFMLVR